MTPAPVPICPSWVHSMTADTTAATSRRARPARPRGRRRPRTGTRRPSADPCRPPGRWSTRRRPAARRAGHRNARRAARAWVTAAAPAHPDVVPPPRTRRSTGSSAGCRLDELRATPRAAAAAGSAARRSPRHRCLRTIRPSPAPSIRNWSLAKAKSSPAKRCSTRTVRGRRRCADRRRASATAARCPRPTGTRSSKPMPSSVVAVEDAWPRARTSGGCGRCGGGGPAPDPSSPGPPTLSSPACRAS